MKSLELLLEANHGKINTLFNANRHVIKGDHIHLTNVLYNLLDNAIKYSNPNPEVTIATENQKDKLMIKIKDNGIGIESKHIRKIFDKFYRVPTGDIHNVKGFGLGLYYVKTVVKIHKGSIQATSRLNDGTEFIICLPLSKES